MSSSLIMKRSALLSHRIYSRVKGQWWNTFTRTFRVGAGSADDSSYDIGIIGGGIVGLATARELINRFPTKRLVLFEKEKSLATHQTGHNSGVIHCGIYYKPGSLKARLCVRGNALSYQYLEEKGIPFERCGKLIVATKESEISKLQELFDRGIQNGVPNLTLLSTRDEIRKEEPHCQGVSAIKCETTGIVDWGTVARSFGEDFEAAGGEILTNQEAIGFDAVKNDKHIEGDEHDISVTFQSGEKKTFRNIIVCAGLQADVMAQLSGGKRDPQIVPFRGEYLILKPQKRHLVKGNIYPVPDDRFPFLGVHFTPRVDGSLWIGPNAVLAFSREGYSYKDISFGELWNIFTYAGFLKLASKYLDYGFSEFSRSIFLSLQLKEIQKFIPQIGIDDIVTGPSGVRAQALSMDGKLVDDFAFDQVKELNGKQVGGILHLRNAPSPAATSSLSIAEYIADTASDFFQLNQ